MTENTSDSLLPMINNHPHRKEYYIGTWDDLPAFSRDNEYIRKGYRINFNTVPRILCSLFMCHNETTNIWSHIFGIILFIGFIIYIATTSFNDINSDDANIISKTKNSTEEVNGIIYLIKEYMTIAK